MPPAYVQLPTSRLGIISDEVAPTLATAIDFALTRRLSHLEIRTIDGRNALHLTDLQADAIRTELAQRGLFVSCLASPVFKCALDDRRPVAQADQFGAEGLGGAEQLALLQRALTVARCLGTPRVRIFSFLREVNPLQHEQEIVTFFRQAAALAADAEIVLVVENEPACNGGLAHEVGRLVRAIDSPWLRALWDPGNEIYAGGSVPDGYASICDVLAHVHLKDALWQPQAARCVPIGQGAVPFAEQFVALQADGYTGLFSIETHYVPPGGTALDGSAMSVQGLQDGGWFDWRG